MKIEELAALLKKPVIEGEIVVPVGVPITRQDRLIGPVPFSICFPHTSRHSQREHDSQEELDRALQGMEREALMYNPDTKRFTRMHTNRYSPDAHLGGVEL